MMKTYTVVIADDEPNARAYLIRLLQNDEQINLLKECKNGVEVSSFIEKIQPDIVFLDVEMPGATGLDVVKKVSDNTAVIFTTAFEEYAVKAFEFKVLDYLLKPFDEDRFKVALKRAKDHVELNKQQEFTQKMFSMLEDYKSKQSSELRAIELKKKGFIEKVNVEEINYVEASSVYAELNTDKGKELYRSSLQELEHKLPDHFLRIHRAFIINLNKISEVRYNNNNTYDFHMKDGTSITSGRTYKEPIMKKFK